MYRVLLTHDAKKPDPDLWKKAVENHNIWLKQLTEFNVPVIAGSRPAIKEGKFLNVGFVWTREGGINDVHEK